MSSATVSRVSKERRRVTWVRAATHRFGCAGDGVRELPARGHIAALEPGEWELGAPNLISHEGQGAQPSLWLSDLLCSALPAFTPRVTITPR